MAYMVNIIAAVGVLELAIYARTSLMDAEIWWWTGLNQVTPRTSDYVPIFPFFSAVLVGIAAGKIAVAKGLLNAGQISSLTLDLQNC